MKTPGAFLDDTTVLLQGGFLLTGVQPLSTLTGYSGWSLSGTLYISHDGGKTWQPSDLTFRCG